MFTRLSWFLMGLAAGAGVSAWFVARLARTRQALTPANLRHSAARSLADALEGAGTRLRTPNGQG